MHSLTLPVSDSSTDVVLPQPRGGECMTWVEFGRQLYKRNFIHAEGDQWLVLLLMENRKTLLVLTKFFS